MIFGMNVLEFSVLGAAAIVGIAWFCDNAPEIYRHLSEGQRTRAHMAQFAEEKKSGDEDGDSSWPGKNGKKSSFIPDATMREAVSKYRAFKIAQITMAERPPVFGQINLTVDHKPRMAHRRHAKV